MSEQKTADDRCQHPNLDYAGSPWRDHNTEYERTHPIACQQCSEGTLMKKLLREALQDCLAALADIALSDDMTEEQRRHKAQRIYDKWALRVEDCLESEE